MDLSRYRLTNLLLSFWAYQNWRKKNMAYLSPAMLEYVIVQIAKLGAELNEEIIKRFMPDLFQVVHE